MVRSLTRGAVAAALAISFLAFPSIAAETAKPGTTTKAERTVSVMPARKPGKKKHAPSKLVMAIQNALNKQGAKLVVDGRMGKRTRIALKQFQAKSGLPQTGRADKATRTRLGV